LLMNGMMNSMPNPTPNHQHQHRHDMSANFNMLNPSAGMNAMNMGMAGLNPAAAAAAGSMGGQAAMNMNSMNMSAMAGMAGMGGAMNMAAMGGLGAAAAAGLGNASINSPAAAAAVAAASSNAAQGTAELPLPSPHSLFHRDGSRRMRGGVIEPFPEKLHRLLLEVESAGRSDVISFVANGRAFAIHKPDKFFKEIVPLYFRQSRLSSFKRQLNLYGFELINTGPARGGYYHELFVKDQPELCRRMRRVAVKVVSSKSQQSRSGTNANTTSTQQSTEQISSPSAPTTTSAEQKQQEETNA